MRSSSPWISGQARISWCASGRSRRRPVGEGVAEPARVGERGEHGRHATAPGILLADPVADRVHQLDSPASGCRPPARGTRARSRPAPSTSRRRASWSSPPARAGRGSRPAARPRRDHVDLLRGADRRGEGHAAASARPSAPGAGRLAQPLQRASGSPVDRRARRGTPRGSSVRSKPALALGHRARSAAPSSAARCRRAAASRRGRAARGKTVKRKTPFSAQHTP